MKGKQSWVGREKVGLIATVQPAKTMRGGSSVVYCRPSLPYCPCRVIAAVSKSLQEGLTGRLAVGPLIALCYCLACKNPEGFPGTASVAQALLLPLSMSCC